MSSGEHAAIAAVTLHPGLLATATAEQRREWEVALREVQGAGLKLRAAGVRGEALEMQIRAVPGGFDLRVRRPSGLLVRELPLRSSERRSSIDEYLGIVGQMQPDAPDFSMARIEVLDVAKRLAHDEGAQRIRRLLQQSVVLDLETARNLFTLLCVMAYRR
jgi:uncharacterized protein (UPF0262 family)